MDRTEFLKAEEDEGEENGEDNSDEDLEDSDEEFDWCTSENEKDTHFVFVNNNRRTIKKGD